VHVAAPHQCHGLLIEPPLRVDLAVEGLGDLAAGRVAEVRPVPLARPQRPLWASTSTKDPAYPDTRYVVDLVAPGVVNTMPEATLRAVADHGVVPMDSVRDQYDESQEVLDRLAALGIDYDDVVTTLEDDGVARFDAAWADLADQLARQFG
jgi:transaldolase